MTKSPFFYDITLRDGNQSLKRPWNIDEKEEVFKLLMDLKIPAVEAGFPASSEMDFETCKRLAEIAPSNVTISGLARAVEHDIIRAVEAIRPAKKPRLHTFIAMSPFNMKYVLNKRPEEVQKQQSKPSNSLNQNWEKMPISNFQQNTSEIVQKISTSLLKPSKKS